MNQEKLGHYTLLGKIGSGGMGDVYVAQDETLGRRVALKVLPAETAADPERLGRFQREARAVAALNHPNIVTIHSVEEEAGTHFLTMELVEGHTLTRLIPEGGLTLDRVFELAVPVLDAISAAHETGIAHRDLKPDNIMVTDKGLVKVLDFGLAKLVTDHARDAGLTLALGKTQTEEGRILGTVAYMSPEQAEGKTVDHRSDIFSMGIILYEMVTGRRPFHGDSNLSTLSSILRDTPAPVTTMRGGLPNHLGRIIQRCLAKDPRERYQTALDVKTELVLLKRETDTDVGASLAPSEPRVVPEGGDSTGMGPRPASGTGSDSGSAAAFPPAETRRPWLPWAAAATAVVLAGVIWLVRASGPGDGAAVSGSGPVAERTAAAAAEKKSVVVFPFENLGAADDAYFAAGMTEEITSRLAMVDGLSVMSRTSAVQYDKTGKTMQQIGKELGVDYVLEGTVRWERRSDGTSQVRVTPQLISTADDSHVWADRYDRAMDEIFQVQSEIAEEVVRNLNVTLQPAQEAAFETRPTGNMDAYHAYLRGWDLVEREYKPETWDLAVQMFERAVTLDPNFHQAYFALSRTHSGFSHFAWDRSPERLAKAKAAADKAMELDPESPWSYMAIGYYHYWGKKEYEAALQAFMTAERKLDNNTEVQEAIANVRRRQGDFEGALAYYRKAMDLDPRSGGKIFNVAETLTILHDYAAAEPLYDTIISLDPDVSRGYNGKWWNRILMTGNPGEAGRILDACPAEVDAELTVNRFWTAFFSRDFSRAATLAAACPRAEGEQFYYYVRSLMKGWAYAGMNDSGRARAEFDSARVVLEALAAENPRDARARSALGMAYAGLGRKDDAIREGRAGVDLLPESLDAWIYLSRLNDLSRIYAQTGEHEAAIDLLENLLGRPGNTVSPALLRVSPVYDPLRENPRFRKLVEEPL